MGRISKSKLISDCKVEFKKIFKCDSQIISIAPGRINIIGEHTDYNSGLAMPQAIDKWICTLISQRSDRNINIYSSAFKKKQTIDLDDLSESKQKWQKYILGSIQAFNSKHSINTGFNIFIGGNIPIGFGMSSSAALEVSILYSLMKMLNIKLEKFEILKLSNLVEKKYLGINSGMLDQYASLFSNKKKMMVVDFSILKHRYFNYSIKNAKWILINSMVSRELVSSLYNKRVKECKEGLGIINQKLKIKKTFNEVNIDDLSDFHNDSDLRKRLIHLVNENKRVKKMKNAIQIGNLAMIGELLNRSHISLSKNYEVSCKEIESIIKISRKQIGFYGGRIMGGGFGGCTINLVEESRVTEFIDAVKKHFFTKFKYKIDFEYVNFTDGAMVYLNNKIIV